MSFENLSVVSNDGVTTISITRPKVLNALSGSTLTELGEAVSDAQADEECGAIVITGGPTDKKPAFAAGADIAEMNELGAVELRDHSRLGQLVFDSIERSEKPVIAAVNGFALGGGLELAMSCHMRWGSASALIGQPEVNLGIIPGFGGTQRLARLVGTGRATEMLLSGDMYSAQDAERMGLFDRVLADDELEGAVAEFAGKLAKKAPIATRFILDAVMRGRDMAMDDAQRIEADLFGLISSTDDVREGLTAFLEKRAATFKGK